jgi:hypothetical protein
MNNNEEIKYFAIKASSVMWMLLIVILFSMFTFIYSLHQISEIKSKYGELREKVLWNEDQSAEINRWKNEAYQEAILNKGDCKNAERKASRK